MKATIRNINLNFPFDKYCELIFAVVPTEDLVGILDEFEDITRRSNESPTNLAPGGLAKYREWYASLSFGQK